MKNKKLQAFLNFLILFFLTALVLYFSLKDNFELIVKQIFSMNLFWLLASFGLMILYWLFKAFTVQKIANNFNSSYSLGKAVRLVIETNFFHAVTPFSSGGQPYEIYSLNKNKIKVTDATNIAIQNFIVYQIALVLLGIISLTINNIFDLFSSSVLLQKLVAIGFIINTLVIVALFLVTFGRKINRTIVDSLIHLLAKLRIIRNKEKILEKSDKYLSEFHNGAKQLIKNFPEFIMLVFIQLVSLCCLYLVPLTLLYGTGNYSSFNVLTSIVTSAYVMLIGSFVPVPGGTGGLEYGFISFYGNFISGSSLTAIMLVWRFITYYFGMILGAIVLNIRKK